MISTALMHHIQQRLPAASTHALVSSSLSAGAATGIPTGVSNRHVHLSQADIEQLFGPGYQLNPLKALSQPGQFAAKECVMVVGPKGTISNVRVLGPARTETQLEVLRPIVTPWGLKPLCVSRETYTNRRMHCWWGR
ncbi:ethanolamine utilization protein similar to PduL [Photobacterium aphoticum]|uniref:Phosphate propanoyltransferase n=1 Tax=Photobacterium aphoticum TaxID=754436 RepID=A0A090QM85_9GAMM|nr:ethanolamine utilization protein similar to PduL [Photobacterium aphoticum]